MIVITTATGSKYVFNRGFVYKNQRDYAAVHDLKSYPLSEVQKAKTLNKLLGFGIPDKELTIGSRLYVSCRDFWWLTSPIISIETTITDED